LWAVSSVGDAADGNWVPSLEKENSVPRVTVLAWPALFYLDQTGPDFIVRVTQRFDEQRAKRSQCD
jgi:hypothetical protein